jgi:hypothetical protein
MTEEKVYRDEYSKNILLFVNIILYWGKMNEKKS